MSYPKSLREQLGLPQSVFANLLNCSKGHVSMAETGRRQLPANALLVAGQMENALQQMDKNNPHESLQTEKLLKFLHKHIQNQSVALMRLSERAENLAQTLEPQKAFITMAANFDAAPLPTGDGTHLDEMALMHRKTIQSFNGLLQKKMRADIAIAGLSAEIACATKIITDIEQANYL